MFYRGKDSIPAKQFRVTLGEYNLRETEVPAAIIENIQNVIVHPGHTCGQYVNDIAILELESPIIWSDSVQPACLPTGQGELGYKSFEGERAIAAGWGWLGEDRSKCNKLFSNLSPTLSIYIKFKLYIHVYIYPSN